MRSPCCNERVCDMTIDPKTQPSPAAPRELNPHSATADATAPPRPIRLLRIKQVLELVGLKKATVYQLHKNGLFPRSVKITGRAVGWVEEEVQRWLAERRDGRS
jgi:prophage regulatory protein